METTVTPPIILDLGKTSRKSIRQLGEGSGKLVADVQDAVAQVTASLGDQANGKQLVPMILVYQKKRRKNKNGGGLFPLF